MTEMKKGDEVIFIGPKRYPFTPGKTYIVERVYKDGCIIVTDDDGVGRVYSKFSFRAVNKQEELKEKNMNKIKEQAQKTYDYIKPYEKYILAAALLIALDYFIFKGELSGKIKQLANKVSERLMGVLDKAIEKIGLGESNDK